MHINETWHRAHPMPPRATAEQRLAWHLEHREQCTCRVLTQEQLEKLQAAALKPRKERAPRSA